VLEHLKGSGKSPISPGEYPGIGICGRGIFALTPDGDEAGIDE
jgi:hypothetical protein